MSLFILSNLISSVLNNIYYDVVFEKSILFDNIKNKKKKNFDNKEKKEQIYLRRSYQEIQDFYNNLKNIYFCNFFPHFPKLEKDNSKNMEFFFNKIIQYDFVLRDKNFRDFFEKKNIQKNQKNSFLNEGYQILKDFTKKLSEGILEKIISKETPKITDRIISPKSLEDLKKNFRIYLIYLKKLIEELNNLIDSIKNQSFIELNKLSENEQLNQLKNLCYDIQEKKINLLDYLQNQILFKIYVFLLGFV
jgi:hypothetical protein